MRNHEKAFSDIKNYYNDITLNNLALINSLKVCVHECVRHLLCSCVNCTALSTLDHNNSPVLI